MANDKELLAEVASMYYQQDLIQSEIARRLGLSRPKISRLLKEARETGVVKISIDYPWKKNIELAARLEERFKLKFAAVLVSRGRLYEEVLRGLGYLAARYLESVLKPNHILGISWGTAVYQTANALNPKHQLSIKVVQMIGAVGSRNPLIDGPDLARLLANQFGGGYYYLPAPLLVKSPTLRDALMQEEKVQETLALARKADVALVGIGSMVPGYSSLVRAGHLTAQAATELESTGIVGDICARQYDIHGQVVDSDINQRIIGIDLSDLHQIDHVIGVAGGVEKAKTVLAALRGGHVKALVTDDVAAEKVLEMDQAI